MENAVLEFEIHRKLRSEPDDFWTLRLYNLDSLRYYILDYWRFGEVT